MPLVYKSVKSLEDPIGIIHAAYTTDGALQDNWTLCEWVDEVKWPTGLLKASYMPVTCLGCIGARIA